MIRKVIWAEEAEQDLLDIPWQEAERVVNAVTLLAIAGEGAVIRIPSGAGPDEHRLYVPPDHRYYVLVRADDELVYAQRVLVSP